MYQIKNLKKVDHVLGAIAIMKTETFTLTHVQNGKEMREVREREVQDYVRPAELIQPGKLSASLTREQMKLFDTHALQVAVETGELNLYINGKPLKPEASNKPVKASSLLAPVSAEAAEASAVQDILAGK